jgi:ABC-type transport system involved in multi-copper enzyme maturation permease subunit
MSGALIAYRWEVRKLMAQKRMWLGIAAAALVPVIFLASIQISKVTIHPPDGPYDTPLGLNLRRSGLALDLVVFKLIGVIGPALIVATVAGDIVAGEDMAGTLKTVLVRSLRRGDILAAGGLRRRRCAHRRDRVGLPSDHGPDRA